MYYVSQRTEVIFTMNKVKTGRKDVAFRIVVVFAMFYSGQAGKRKPIVLNQLNKMD